MVAKCVRSTFNSIIIVMIIVVVVVVNYYNCCCYCFCYKKMVHDLFFYQNVAK